MDMLLKFGIGADYSTFELPCYATSHFEMGIFKMGDFKIGNFKTGFAENLGHRRLFFHYISLQKNLCIVGGALYTDFTMQVPTHPFQGPPVGQSWYGTVLSVKKVTYDVRFVLMMSEKMESHCAHWINLKSNVRSLVATYACYYY